MEKSVSCNFFISFLRKPNSLSDKDSVFKMAYDDKVEKATSSPSKAILNLVK